MFTIFSSLICIFCNKTLNCNNKTRRCDKASFCKTLKKTPSSGKFLISTCSILLFFLGGGEGEGGGRLFEFEWEWEEGVVGVGAYSRLGAY